MTIGLDTPRPAGRWFRRRRPAVSEDQAVLRALCHDLGTPLASLRSLLGHLDVDREDADALAGLALEQADSLVSMLRTAAATGGAPPVGGWPRRLVDVVQASLQVSGLPPGQVRLTVAPTAGDVRVGDARVQRILTNLLENAYRHGAGRPVTLAVGAQRRWVRLVVTQAGVPDRVVAHLQAEEPPADLTGLGLWSVQRQARELGGQVSCHRDGAGLSVVVDLPDR